MARTGDGLVTTRGEVEHRSSSQLIEEVLMWILGDSEIDNQVVWVYDDSHESRVG